MHGKTKISSGNHSMASLPYVIFISSFFLCRSCKTFCLLERNVISGARAQRDFHSLHVGNCNGFFLKPHKISGILAPSTPEIAGDSFKA
jgi:hypothetical protein